MSNWILIGPVVGVVLITVALVVGYVVIPPIIHQQIIQSTRLERGTEQYDRWVVIPQPLNFKVYIWNVTNVDAVQAGGIPILQEVGPYVYTQTRRKENIRFTRDEERVSYYQMQNYVFNSELSSGTQDDIVRPLNINLNAVLQTMESLAPQFMPIVNDNLHTIFGPTDSLFLNTTVRNFLFDGIEFCKDAEELPALVCSIIRAQESSSIRAGVGTSLLFSMFNHKNTTHGGLHEINTGTRRIERLLQIQRWRGDRTLPYWMPAAGGTPSRCQFINGTDGTTAGPFRQPGDDFYIFSGDLCRSIHMGYTEPTSFNGINAFRYTAKQSFMRNQDSCFCINATRGALLQDNGCLLPGALDLSQCVGAPIIATLPHFLHADETYARLLLGTEADPERHDLYVDIEPNTGTPIRGGGKMQFNMFVRRLPGIDITNNFNVTRLVPVLWIDEYVELNDEMTDLIYRDLLTPLLIIAIVQWTIVGIGAALFVGMLIWFFIARNNRLKGSSSVQPIYTNGAN